MNKQVFYRASIIEESMGISSFALVKRKGTSIAALAYFKLMTHEWNSTLSLFRLRFNSPEKMRSFHLKEVLALFLNQ